MHLGVTEQFPDHRQDGTKDGLDRSDSGYHPFRMTGRTLENRAWTIQATPFPRHPPVSDPHGGSRDCRTKALRANLRAGATSPQRPIPHLFRPGPGCGGKGGPLMHRNPPGGTLRGFPLRSVDGEGGADGSGTASDPVPAQVLEIQDSCMCSSLRLSAAPGNRRNASKVLQADAILSHSACKSTRRDKAMSKRSSPCWPAMAR